MKKRYCKTITCPNCGKVRTVLTSSKGILCVSCSNSFNAIGRDSRLDITGKRFGKLVPTSFNRIENQKTYWNCQCDCGNKSVHSLGHLRNGDSKSCGCLYRSLDGKSKRRSYKSWDCMKRRCLNKKSNRWHIYGGRGIKVCDRWIESFLNFLEDMGERPVGTSLDRIDVNGDYCKENCRWATPKEQARNKSNNTIIEAFGKKLTAAQWEEETGIKDANIEYRIKSGWSVEDALTKKVQFQKKSIGKIKAFGQELTPVEWSRETGIKSKLICSRLRNGMTAEKALTKKVRSANKISAFGETLKISEWASRFGLKETTLHGRLAKGLKIEEALTLKVKQPIKLTLNDETLTIREWSKRIGIPESTIGCRIDRGWTDKETLTLVPSPRHKKNKLTS